jgi:hypothetical protein
MPAPIIIAMATKAVYPPYYLIKSLLPLSVFAIYIPFSLSPLEGSMHTSRIVSTPSLILFSFAEHSFHTLID